MLKYDCVQFASDSSFERKPIKEKFAQTLRKGVEREERFMALGSSWFWPKI